VEIVTKHGSGLIFFDTCQVKANFLAAYVLKLW